MARSWFPHQRNVDIKWLSRTGDPNRTEPVSLMCGRNNGSEPHGVTRMTGMVSNEGKVCRHVEYVLERLHAVTEQGGGWTRR